MKNKKLLVISSGYPNESGSYLSHTFVKGFVDAAAAHFNKIYVLVLIPYIPSFLRDKLNKYPKSISDYSYENIEIHYEKYPYLPIWPLNKLRGKIAFQFLSDSFKKKINLFDFIHANLTSPSGVFANLLSRKYKKDFILTVHEDHDWLVDEIKQNNKLYLSAWKSAKVLIRVNKLDNALLSKYNNNVITIPNGFNQRKFKIIDRQLCRDKLGYRNSEKLIVNIGFYNDQKNQGLLIDAINLLPMNIKRNLKCLIIGGGPKHTELKKHVLEKGLEEIIYIVGQVKHYELPIYLNAADIFCLSSNSEGNPTVMFEALALGLPYVGTNIGGVPEIITSEQYGLLCPPKMKNELSKIIEIGLNRKWKKDVIIQYAKQFSWENIFLKTKEYY